MGRRAGAEGLRPGLAALGGAALAALAAVAVPAGFPAAPGARAATRPPSDDASCVSCHSGIEEMHPWSRVGCVDCHGGDGTKPDKASAHVVPRAIPPGDERVLPLGFDPPFLRFRNPTDLRVVKETCGGCHPDQSDRVLLSLHSTTTGHLGDGLYENGVVKERGPRVSIFGATDPSFDRATAPPGAVASLQRIGGFRSGGDRSSLATHFSDLPRKACMHCHLWSPGRAVRGRLGMDGDYRGAGCAACHVPYDDDGLSRSGDAVANRLEPGHPSKHAMVKVPRTDTCVKCHYGDASIGLTFRGLAQPVPGMPQSPDAPGFSPRRLNGVYYLRDPAVNPPDVHHLRGMQCADCHTGHDTMGDGRLYTRMEDAVEISCESCHGTPEARTKGLTERGRRVRGLEIRDDGVWLVSPSDGRRRRVKQARDIVTPDHADFNSAAARAMTPDHGRLACYACHTSWNPNFFGFHFDRHEGFTQIDMLDGTRTQGRVTTQEKVFATLRQHYIGWDSHGAVAPYMVGFSTMATVRDEAGRVLLDQEMPVTAAGLSGMTMIHHQPHATTPRARDCAECHRAPAALGFGSVNFRLAREFLFVAGDRGLHAVSLDRANPANGKVLAQIGLPAVRALALRCDDLQGRALYAFAAGADGALYAVDLRNPLFPRIADRVADAVADPRAAAVMDDLLLVADGTAGLKVFDASRPTSLRLLGTTDLRAPAPEPAGPDAPTTSAPSRAPDPVASGLFVDGPRVFVAAGPAGVLLVDLRDPSRPEVVGRAMPADRAEEFPARGVSFLFQFSRPNAADPTGPRLPARALAAAATEGGVALFDFTHAASPQLLAILPTVGPTLAVALGTVWESGSEGGGIRASERDLVFALTARGVHVLDVTTPGGGEPFPPSFVPLAGGQSLAVLRSYNPPFLQTRLAVATAAGVTFVEMTRPLQPSIAGSVAQVGSAFLAPEEFPLDRMIDSKARPLKDISHEGARYLDLEESRRVLGAPIPPARR